MDRDTTLMIKPEEDENSYGQSEDGPGQGWKNQKACRCKQKTALERGQRTDAVADDTPRQKDHPHRGGNKTEGYAKMQNR
jgi:hypothetical protein